MPGLGLVFLGDFHWGWWLLDSESRLPFSIRKCTFTLPYCARYGYTYLLSLSVSTTPLATLLYCVPSRPRSLYLPHYRWLCLFLLLQVASCVGLQLHDTANPIHSPTPIPVRSQTLQLSSFTPDAAHHMFMFRFTPHAPCRCCSMPSRSVGRSIWQLEASCSDVSVAVSVPRRCGSTAQHSVSQKYVVQCRHNRDVGSKKKTRQETGQGARDTETHDKKTRRRPNQTWTPTQW